MQPAGVRSPSDLPELREVLARQDGVVSRRQALEAGLASYEIEGLVRRERWARHAKAVYVDHSGPLTGPQRAWVAVLCCWPAALHLASALTPPSTTGPVLVAVDRDRRRPVTPPWVVVRRLTRLEGSAHWNTSPPRVRCEDAVLHLAADAHDDLAAVGVLATACGDRRTTPARLLTALDRWPRLGRRPWLASVLTDLAQGTTSVLEHGYLTRVERAHGLPRARWQVRVESGGRRRYRDATYDGGAVVELDGAAHHGTRAQRDDDLQRDLELAADGGATARLGYGQVYGDTCRTTVLVVRFLRSRGVVVDPVACGSGCPVGALSDAA